MNKANMILSLYANGYIGNHGCEALYRSIGHIIPIEKAFTLDNRDADDPIWQHINIQRFTIRRGVLRRFSWRWFVFRLLSLWREPDYVYYRQVFRQFRNQIVSGDVYASIGGDNYCYGACQWLYALNDIIRKRGGYTVLLGCSITPKDIDAMMMADLKKFDLIIARESITYQALRDRGITKLELLPDPAFSLGVEECELPSSFIPGKTVGINMSDLITRYETNDGIIIQNFENLICYILKNTDMHVALVPHVVTPGNNDLEVMRPFYHKYASSGRVSLIPELNCCQLKYIIGKCRFLVAARTHASIAAYSQAVPTLVIGYSVKAEGIAKDLFGTAENYVKDVRALVDADDMTKCFQWFIENEENIRSYYRQNLACYIEPLSHMEQILDKHLIL